MKLLLLLCVLIVMCVFMWIRCFASVARSTIYVFRERVFGVSLIVCEMFFCVCLWCNDDFLFFFVLILSF